MSKTILTINSAQEANDLRNRLNSLEYNRFPFGIYVGKDAVCAKSIDSALERYAEKMSKPSLKNQGDGNSISGESLPSFLLAALSSVFEKLVDSLKKMRESVQKTDTKKVGIPLNQFKKTLQEVRSSVQNEEILDEKNHSSPSFK